MAGNTSQKIGNYVKAAVSALVAEDPGIAHGFGHLDRVRGWALCIAEHEIQAIATAIRLHSSVSGGGALGGILRNADILDALGSVGMMRAFTTKYAQPEYDPRRVKVDTWGTTAREYGERFAEGRGIGVHVVDQANFQISWYVHLTTEKAKEIARCWSGSGKRT